MIKQGIKNYLSSLKYFFTPLGTMFLGMMIGFSILLPGIAGAITELFDGIKELALNVNLDFGTLIDNLWTAVRAIDWDNPVEAIQTLLSAEWINEILTQELQAILGTDFETFNVQITELVSNFTEAVSANLIVFFVFWALGFISGFFLVKFQVRKNIAKRSLWKLILATFINSILTTVFVIAAAVLFAIWGWSVFISTVLLILLLAIIALLEAYIIHGRGKIPLKKIVNLKNAGLYALTNIIILGISACLTVIACLINSLMGLFVGLALTEIAVIVVNLNAEAYVKDLTENQAV